MRVHRTGDSDYTGTVERDCGDHALVRWDNGSLTHTLWRAMVVLG